MDWYVPLSEPIFTSPTINYGIEINPVAFVPPAVGVSSGALLVIDLVSIDAR